MDCLPGPSSSLWPSAGTLLLRATSLCLAVSVCVCLHAPQSLCLCVRNALLTFFSTCADEPVRPIDPAAWVSHSVAMTGAYPPFPGSSSLSTITSSSSVTETERETLYV